MSGGKLWPMQKGATNQVSGSTTGQTPNFNFPTAVSNVTIGLADLNQCRCQRLPGSSNDVLHSASNAGWTGYSGPLHDGSSTTWSRDSTLGSASYLLTNTTLLTSFGLLFTNLACYSLTASRAQILSHSLSTKNMSVTNVSSAHQPAEPAV